MKKVAVMLAILTVGQMLGSAASAHTMLWRAGEHRMKAFGHCAKGPCMKRADFGRSKRHHHHGSIIVTGSVRHDWTCRVL